MGNDDAMAARVIHTPSGTEVDERHNVRLEG